MSTSIRYPTLYSTIHIKILLFPTEHFNTNMISQYNSPIPIKILLFPTEHLIINTISHTLQYHSYQNFINSHWICQNQYDIPHFTVPFIWKYYYFPLKISTTIWYPTLYSNIHIKILVFPTQHVNINTISHTLKYHSYQNIINSHWICQHQYDTLHFQAQFISKYYYFPLNISTSIWYPSLYSTSHIKILLFPTEQFNINTIPHTLQYQSNLNIINSHWICQHQRDIPHFTAQFIPKFNYFPLYFSTWIWYHNITTPYLSNYY
jgi:hypothetical protein